MCKYWGVPANITQAALSRTVVGTPFAAASKGHVNSKTEWFGDVGNQHASTGNGFLDRSIEGEVKRKYFSHRWSFSCFQPHVLEQGRF